MAAVSAPLAPRPLTPTGVQSGAWSYSVPLENQLPLESADNYDNNDNRGARQTLAEQTNGHLLASKTSRNELYKTQPPSRPSQLQNQGYPARIDTGNRKMSESGSDDNFSPDFRDRGGLNGVEYGAINGGEYTDEEDPEHSRWIHKDKLERMEIQEMERLGIRIPRSRAASRSNGRSRSRDNKSAAYNRNDQQGQQKRQRTDSTPREEKEEHNWDLRLPEERAEEQDLHDSQWEQATGSKSASRIPVNKKSPLPIPLDYIERDTPMLYGKVPAGPEDTISYSKSRGRSGSVKVLEDSPVPPVAKPAPRAVSGRRVATDVSPTKKTGPRKTSAPTSTTRPPVSQQKPKTRSGSGSNGARPVTRSGELGSGSISKRPEGDPPWLATMYKPDPRLPPDQQILPTHAKRMQQEQWEKDGKFGNTYDTSFRPLNHEEYEEREPPPVVTEPTAVEEQRTKLQPAELQPGWPLLSPKSPTLSTGRPGTAGGGGSYSTMPKISSPIRPFASPIPSPSVTTRITSPLRVPEPPPEDEKKKKEGGCACCIVM